MQAFSCIFTFVSGLFPFDFFSPCFSFFLLCRPQSSDSQRRQNKSKLIRRRPLRKVHSAFCISYWHSENACASQRENKLNIDEHQALVRERKMVVLLIKERAFGVRKRFSFLPRGEDIFIYFAEINSDKNGGWK